MKLLSEWLAECQRTHGHLCAGQVLGVRMALAGCREVGVEDPEDPMHAKSLVVWVEIDRCAVDAVSTVTRCRLGKRTLKFADYGIQAATFLNTITGAAVRVVAREEARHLSVRYVPGVQDERTRQREAYGVMPDEELFHIQRVTVRLSPEDQPGSAKRRVNCSLCGVRVNDGREISRTGLRVEQGGPLCRPCAGGAYFTVPVGVAP